MIGNRRIAEAEQFQIDALNEELSIPDAVRFEGQSAAVMEYDREMDEYFIQPEDGREPFWISPMDARLS